MKTFCVLLLAAFLQLNRALPTLPNDVQLSHDSYILNGQEAKIGEFPHQLLLNKKYAGTWYFTCGSVLISENQALTAAHCVEDIQASSLQVVAGLHSRMIEDHFTQKVQIKKVVRHPRYNDGSGTFSNDIAIMTFATTLNFTDRVQPIVWNHEHNVTFAGDSCKISGWGSTTGITPDTLQMTKINVVSNAVCKKLFRTLDFVRIYPGHICVYEPNMGACSGDSGGPLTCQHKGRSTLAGLASWVVFKGGMCEPTFPSAYARVSHFKKFITDNLV